MGEPRLYLEEGNPHQDPGHHDQVILQPLLKLAHTAFGVDGALLLELLGRHKTRLSLPTSAQIPRPSSTLPSPSLPIPAPVSSPTMSAVGILPRGLCTDGSSSGS